MLGNLAVDYYRQGYSCSRCILLAVSKRYGISTEQLYKALGGVSNGFGVGALCSVPVVCVMVLGLIYPDEVVVKQRRLSFLMEFRSRLKSLNCSELQQTHKGCEYIIKTGCDILEGLI
jgi:hypothetical protein